ncbi:MAG: hypothetical protein QW727_00350 [Candidatus Pacearchaeota archaeon]
MKKRIFALLFISILFLSLIIFFGSAQAAEEATSSQLSPTQPVNCSKPHVGLSGQLYDDSLGKGNLINLIATKLCIWESGNLGVEGFTLKYFFLILVVILIYSALSYVNFPDTFSNQAGGSFVRFLISLIVGILSTFAITTPELLSMLQSYTALGVTLSLFFPIMVLMFFSLVTSRKASPIGIFGQKILWMIYSIYLFIKSVLLYYVSSAISKGKLEVISDSNTINLTEHPTLKFFLGEAPKVSLNDNTITIILLIMAISVFVIFVLGNKYVIAWIAKEERDAEIEAQKSMLERSHAYDKLRAEEMKRT